MKHRPIARFWFLETVARMPYFSYISMLHFYEVGNMYYIYVHILYPLYINYKLYLLYHVHYIYVYQSVYVSVCMPYFG